jgi:hypothetical protein
MMPDRLLVDRRRGDANRLGFGVQLGTLLNSLQLPVEPDALLDDGPLDSALPLRVCFQAESASGPPPTPPRSAAWRPSTTSPPSCRSPILPRLGHRPDRRGKCRGTGRTCSCVLEQFHQRLRRRGHLRHRFDPVGRPAGRHARRLDEVWRQVAGRLGADGGFSIDADGRLHAPSVDAIADPPSLTDLRRRCEAMLPRVDVGLFHGFPVSSIPSSLGLCSSPPFLVGSWRRSTSSWSEMLGKDAGETGLGGWTRAMAGALTQRRVSGRAQRDAIVPPLISERRVVERSLRASWGTSSWPAGGPVSGRSARQVGRGAGQD